MSCFPTVRMMFVAALSLSVVYAPLGFGQSTIPAAEEGSWFDHLMGESRGAISGNPAVEGDEPGTGALAGLIPGKPLDDLGLRLGGVWLGDANGLLAGGREPGRWTFNSALIVGANLDVEKLMGWKGGSFGIQFLQFNGQEVDGLDTNGLAGSVQGYNSIVAAKPYTRSELYQVWFRQDFFDEKLTVRIGKMVPTFDFNNLARPVPSRDPKLAIPAVTGLLFTPVYVTPTILGAIPGYYDSAYGVVTTIAPTKNFYLKYGFYDGNVARGAKTGLTGPNFNGYYYNIWEAGAAWVIADKYPGMVAAGLWYQTGVLQGPPGISETGTGGLYVFGDNRIWSNDANTPKPSVRSAKDGKSKMVIEPESRRQHATISAFFQYGINNSETLPMNQSFGAGFTGYGLVPHRPEDSVGVGMSWAQLNENTHDRSSELMFQGYYQARLFPGAYFQPAVSYIPTPGAGPDLGGAWAASIRVMLMYKAARAEIKASLTGLRLRADRDR